MMFLFLINFHARFKYEDVRPFDDYITTQTAHAI